MKKNVLFLSFGLLSLFMFFSCLGEDEDVYVSYGVIQHFSSANNYEILTDKGNTLVVTKSHTSQSIENDKRVLVNYEILSDKEKNRNIYEVRVNGFYSLLSKPPVYESFILQNEEVRRDSIGNDPFNRIAVGFGGNFINIDFELWHVQYSNEKHFINLVYDDLRADADTIYLGLYHNAYGEVLGNNHYLYKGAGRCSFKISDLLPEGVTSKPVKLTWTQYNDYDNGSKICSQTYTFKPGDKSEKYGRKAQDINLISSIITR